MVRTVARIIQADRIADIVLVHDALEGAEVFDIGAIEFQDDVAVSESSLIQRSAGSDFIDVNARYIQSHAEAGSHLLVQAV